MMWELQKNGQPIKRHTTRIACQIEALERGAVVQFLHRGNYVRVLADGWKVKAVPSQPNNKEE